MGGEIPKGQDALSPSRRGVEQEQEQEQRQGQEREREWKRE